MRALQPKARFLVTPAAEIPKKKPVVPELDDVSLEEIKTAAYNAAVKLAADAAYLCLYK